MEQASLETLIAEYLFQNEFTRSLDVFATECQAKGRKVETFSSDTVSVYVQETKTKMMNFFDEGDASSFLRLWEENVLPHLRSKETPGQKIEGFVQIYFAIYPVHPLFVQKGAKETLNQSIARFRSYLETKGSEQSHSFLPYYALSYIPSPTSHPAFTELFTEEWVMDIRSRTEQFLLESIKSPKSAPRLNEMYLTSMSAPSPKSSPTEATSDTVKQELASLRKQKLELAKFSQDVFEELERIITDRKIPGKPLLDSFSQRLSAFSSQAKKTRSAAPRRASTITRQVALASLDYAKVKQDLLSKSVDVNKKGFLLQALRWRLTKSQPGMPRRTVMATYTQYDLLALNSKPHVLGVVLPSANQFVVEAVLRLLNSMGSHNPGRTYILQCPDALSLLVAALTKTQNDTPARQQCLAAVQKLSLRRKAQEMMIELDLIKWLVKILGDKESLSAYTLEYATALLMNLSLRSYGKQKCEQLKETIVSVLSDLIEHENVRVRTYVNGTLYSLLSVPSLKDKALEIGMEDILNYLIDCSPAELQNQLRFILNKLQSDDEGASHSDDEDDDVDDDDSATVEDEEEDEVSKPSASMSNHAQGEELLCSQYLATESAASAEVEAVRKSMELADIQNVKRSTNQRKDAPLHRPTTPLQRSISSPPLPPKRAQPSFNPEEDSVAFQAKPLIANSVENLPKPNLPPMTMPPKKAASTVPSTNGTPVSTARRNPSARN